MNKQAVIYVVQTGQFGYHYPTFNLLNHLKNKFEIKYFGIHEGKQERNYSKHEINTIHVKKGKNSLVRRISLYNIVRKHSRVDKPFKILITYHIFCFPLIFLVGRGKSIVDFRTGFISENSLKVKILNRVLRYESLLFPNKTTLSQGLREFLKLSTRTRIIPLGANPIKLYVSNKDEDILNLVYVGTLFQRNLHILIKGIEKFTTKQNVRKVNLRIIGKYQNRDGITLEKISKGISSFTIEFLGERYGEDLSKLLSYSDIGVSFVPINPKFYYQPVTKTVDYLMCGLPVLATKTLGNIELINDSNGVLIEDDIDSVSNGLEIILSRLQGYNRNQIIAGVNHLKWSFIVNKNLISVIAE